ncbi:MAG: hypothetical protein GX107_00740 [Clostridiales bacterium]|nr:hypothetical protein [Clostridiales bacterium]
MADKQDARTEDTRTAVPENEGYVYQNRRYVGTKETVGYVVFDMTQSFNINLYSARFVTNIVQISLKLQSYVTVINGIWDVVNDVFTGAIVDKTRTRWGKFKPYLMALAIPGTILTCLYWLLPLLFPGTQDNDMTKFGFYLALALIREGVGTFQGIAQTGMMATITPHPVDRTRLITIANFMSGMLGEKLPEQIMTLLLDLVGNGFFGTPEKTYKKLFVFMGNFTTIVGGIAAFWFFMISRERVMQSVERPSIMQGVKSIINNKPVLLLTLSETLNGFSISGSKSDYLIDVLNFASLSFFAGIPGAIVHPVAYTLVPWFRRHFSSRALYIVANYIGNILMVPVFLIGCIGGKKNGLYKRVVPMGITLMVWETVFMFFYGVRKVIPSELYNESMDYCEWKNGYRSEAMTTIAKGLAKKLTAIFSNFITLRVKEWIGYDVTAYTRGSAQSDDAKFGLFAMFTILPFVTSSFGIIPMLFYDLGGKKRERMYEELLARRAALSREATSGDADSLCKVAKAQMEIGNAKQTLDDLDY